MKESQPLTARNAGRLRSLDIFRGICIVAMILVNNPGPAVEVYPPLVHAEWDGWTFADTIFPSFLWIAGFAIPLSTARRIGSGKGRWPLLAHALQRSVLLVACGLFLEGLPGFDLASLQVTGVLQKIAIAYFLAFAIYLWTGWRGQIVSVLGIFALYLGLMVYYPVPGCTAGPWESDCNFARYLDNLELGGHVWRTPTGNDPDGILSVLSSTTSVLFGILAGQLVLSRTAVRLRTATLVASGLLFTSAGMALSRWIPLSKVLWTPSYSILMAGLSAVAFGAVYWVVEERHIDRGWGPFEQFGVNALAAYVVSRLAAIPLKMHVMGRSIYDDLLQPFASPANASLLFALVNVLTVFAIVSWMYRRRIFVKL
jgi:predicted acyltransferase